MPERPIVYRFTRDLRLDDHAGLAAAASAGPVVPVLVIDAATQSRLRRRPRRAAFFCNAVAALEAELRERGTGLIIRRGEPESILPATLRSLDATGVVWSAAYDRAGIERDRQLQSAVEEAGFTASIVHDAPAIAPQESAAARSADGPGYRAFAPYLQIWSELPIVSHEYPLLLRFASCETASEPLPGPTEFGASAQAELAAGPAAARRSFERFLRQDAAGYAAAATNPADDRTSHLSAHFSFGAIAARTVVRAVRERIDAPIMLSEERLALKLFLRALAHRDFFMQLSWFHPRTQDEPLQEKMHAFEFAQTHPALKAWRQGTTGYPLVDAGMRQLHATGWMHPHVRAVAASWLCFDLGVDWRVGRDEWDHWLIEDDPALATGNWQWVAGVGADMAQYPRIYNPERQRRRYDPTGSYVRNWIPELRHVPVEIWRGRDGETVQLALGLYDDDCYAKPAIDHASAARAFLRRYRAFTAPDD